MKILCIPDVHSRKFWRQCIFNNVAKVDKVLFLGDYVDPYSGESELEENIEDGLIDIINLKKNEPDKYILLLGNHDCHYIWSDIPESSRYNRFKAKLYYNIFKEHLDLFKLVYVNENTVFSHAGITQEWAKLVYDNLDIPKKDDNISVIEIAIFLSELDLKEDNSFCSTLGMISHYRGGYYNTGSCIWADIKEHVDLKETYDKIIPIGDDECFQVFGHTQLKEPLITDKWACLDCRKGFIINTLTHEINEC